MNDRPRCSTCEHFTADKDDPKNNAGICQAHPPVLAYTATQQQGLDGKVRLAPVILGSAFPQVMPQGWCGEHKGVSHSAIIQ